MASFKINFTCLIFNSQNEVYAQILFLIIDTNRVWAAAEKAEDDDIYLYTIGLNIGDRTEIDETSSHPLSTYEYLVRSERELNELPGRLRFALKDGKG